MMHPLHLRRPRRAVTKFSRLALVAGGAGLRPRRPGGHAGAPAVAGRGARRGHGAARDERLVLPEVITRELPLRAVASPAAPIVQQVPAPPAPGPAGTTSGAAPLLAALNPFAAAAPAPGIKPDAGTTRDTATRGGTAEAGAAAPVPRARVAPTPAQAPAKKRWELLAKPDAEASARRQPGRWPRPRRPLGCSPAGARRGARGRATAQGLIQPARWAIPANPLRTIYRSQTLTGQLLQAIHSEIPGPAENYPRPRPCSISLAMTRRFCPGARWSLRSRSGNRSTPTRACSQHRATGVTQRRSGGPAGDRGRGRWQHGPERQGQQSLRQVAAGDGGVGHPEHRGADVPRARPGPISFFAIRSRRPRRMWDKACSRKPSGWSIASCACPRRSAARAETFCTIHLLENLQFQRPPLVVR